MKVLHQMWREQTIEDTLTLFCLMSLYELYKDMVDEKFVSFKRELSQSNRGVNQK